MCPTIRIDDEVYNWLQDQAVPFDDTPNSVLRRIAGLGRKERATRRVGSRKPGQNVNGKNSPGRRTKLADGPELLNRWSIPVRQARFHQDGTWYQHLTRFPAALCDPKGYVVFETEAEYQHSKYLRLGKQLNVPGGISSMPGYEKVDKPLT